MDRQRLSVLTLHPVSSLQQTMTFLLLTGFVLSWVGQKTLTKTQMRNVLCRK
jgi:hypothetical protein